MRAARVEGSRTRVVLVDDHVLFRKGLATLFQAEPDFQVVGEAADGLEAIAMAAALRPDLILMDLRMPRMDGLEATRRILETQQSVQIVILSMSEDEDAAFQAVKSGARGYLLKTVEPQALFELLRGVLRGEAALSNSLATKILREFARQAQHPVEPVSPPTQLSPREHAILALVAEGKSNKDIARALDLTENTAKHHLKTLLAKLHLENRVQAAVFGCNGLVTVRPRKSALDLAKPWR